MFSFVNLSMAKNSYKSNTFKSSEKKKKGSFKLQAPAFLKDQRFHLAFGFFLLIASFFLGIAFISYLFTGKADQSVVETANETSVIASGRDAKNWLGFYGAYASHYFIFHWFGLAAFFTPPLLFVIGYKLAFQKTLMSLVSAFWFVFFATIWLSLLLGYVVLTSEGVNEWGFLAGGLGFHLAIVFQSLLGWGTFLLLLLSLIVFIIFFFNITRIGSESKTLKDSPEPVVEDLNVADPDVQKEEEVIEEGGDEEFSEGNDETEELSKWEIRSLELEKKNQPKEDSDGLVLDIIPPRKSEEPVQEVPAAKKYDEDNLMLDVEKEHEERHGNKQENYDPTLDLGNYQYPTLDLLEEYNQNNGVQVSKEELEQNKDKILETLINFKIGISSIKATIGPTVTLYEIVPEAGIKISKIKNLEDDIALSLAALGIRIIAPIPGKGTIGIEVPNKNREMVSMRSVLSTEKFLKSDKELPVVLGKTISNEVHVIDLAKLPHLLIAGATGQGKSVGLNVVLTSLLYKKHPSQLKFVLVDPKKVELTLFNKIERHFLAMLPDSEEAIITDTKKVVNTLNSLCIEMDLRYDLLKDGGARNLKEYNNKFIRRKLNPENGHRFLPYIVLVIDELADLMMTAGKEVETPIARLAQLARAIGIHLVVATQRPSVNVITGVIKANFPARLSFRVTSKIDSRTILDAGGADQLIGMGDMLLSHGSEVIRLQCAFVDTPEVEKVCEYIGSQRGYESAYQLPEFVGEDDSNSVGEVDLGERDALFDDAARLIVMHQQGSTSLIQRKLKLGYNRAGRLIDQLEAAGIVGSFEGSKAREVLIQDEYSLEQLLNELNNNKY
jgi:S-DNA-T family DNA segregation ATPase FtsK/SpoIIIE